MRTVVTLLSALLLVACSKPNESRISSDLAVGIMGGHELKEGETLASYIVGIYDQKQQFLCTGTLIRDNIVLTAAHCVVSQPSQIKIIFGTDAFLTLNAREVDIQKEFVRRVVATKVHEKYMDKNSLNPEIDQNDIAVLKFAGALPTGFKAASLLTERKDLAKDVEATVAGYGVSHVETFPVDIKNTSKKKIEKGLDEGSMACDDSMTECYEVEMSGDGNLRAAQAKIKGFSQSEVRLDESKGQGTCSGDSGGPAFVQKNGQYWLFGVTSRGNALCDFEGVYTNAVEHSDWIQKALQSL